jgi:hypothetical protein
MGGLTAIYAGETDRRLICRPSEDRHLVSHHTPSGVRIMSSHMPPVPPVGRNKTGSKSPKKNSAVSKDGKFVKHEHHPNAAVERQTANIAQNTANEGYFRGRRNG